ncbi:MAG: hypothetical protein NZM04_05590 [Methylacidiphilales bacterium]|nr:hypothetical protein [Candidatus Methylacidiphilales bacterium]
MKSIKKIYADIDDDLGYALLELSSNYNYEGIGYYIDKEPKKYISNRLQSCNLKLEHIDNLKKIKLDECLFVYSSNQPYGFFRGINICKRSAVVFTTPIFTLFDQDLDKLTNRITKEECDLIKKSEEIGYGIIFIKSNPIYGLFNTFLLQLFNEIINDDIDLYSIYDFPAHFAVVARDSARIIYHILDTVFTDQNKLLIIQKGCEKIDPSYIIKIIGKVVGIENDRVNFKDYREMRWHIFKQIRRIYFYYDKLRIFSSKIECLPCFGYTSCNSINDSDECILTSIYNDPTPFAIFMKEFHENFINITADDV